MPNRPKIRVRPRIARHGAVVALAGAAACAGAAAFAGAPASPAIGGKSYFFATREACAASGVFRRHECAAAFANAFAEMLDRAPVFSSIVDCRLRFALCEPRRGRQSYVPVALGVEMMMTPRGAVAAPTFAVETPQSLFPPSPIARAYAPRNALAQQRPPESEGDMLPTDRFEPFSKRQRISASLSFNYAALGTVEGEKRRASNEETPAERRARLRAAPFVE